jgi:hypothetical protein
MRSRTSANPLASNFEGCSNCRASTGAISYQWELNGNNLSDGTDGNGTIVAGSQGPQLLLTNTGVGDAGNYTCVVTFTPSSGSGTPESLSTSAANLAITSGIAPGAATSLSARAFVGTGDNILIGGFYITGKTSVTVLIQAIGPSLAQAPYSVTGTLQHPSLTLHQAQKGKDVVLYSNTAWGSNPILLAAAAAAYAEPVLKPGSADSELLLTLPPGGYTAEVTGADGGTGVALCAIYQIQ